MITGESICRKDIGEEVIGGTILINGNIKVKGHTCRKDLLSNIRSSERCKITNLIFKN